MAGTARGKRYNFSQEDWMRMFIKELRLGNNYIILDVARNILINFHTL